MQGGPMWETSKIFHTECIAAKQSSPKFALYIQPMASKLLGSSEALYILQ